jgi:hypothetical protein
MCWGVLESENFSLSAAEIFHLSSWKYGLRAL